MKALKIFFWVSFITNLLACSPKITTSETDLLLYSQTVKGAKTLSNDEMALILPQKPNRKILKTPITPYLFFYRIGEKFFKPEKFRADLDSLKVDYSRKIALLDSGNLKAILKLKDKKDKKQAKLQRKIDEGNNFMRIFGEKPVFMTSKEIENNQKKLETFAKEKGFFDATVTPKIDTIFGNRLAINYIVSEKKPYILVADSVFVLNSAIEKLLLENAKDSFLKKGNRHQRVDFENEKIRLEQLLLNNGYYGFSREFIKFKADKSWGDSISQDFGAVKYLTIINNPPKGKSHLQYKLSSINFVVDGDQENPNETFKTTTKDNIVFQAKGREFSKNALAKKVLIKSNELYNEISKNETQRLLASIDQFKFAQISFKPDTSNLTLATTIYSVPLEKYTFSGEVGFNVFQGLPGPNGNASLKVRSIFGGLESLEITARASLEGQTGFFLVDDNIYAGKEIGLNASIVFPQILSPRKIASKFDKLNPRTQVGLGINFIDRPEYQRTNFKLAMSYSWQKSLQKSFTFSLFDINLIRTGFKLDTFRLYLEDLKAFRGNNLIESFRRSFVSSMSGTYTFNENVIGKNKRARYMRLYAESGGTTLNLLANQRFNAIETLFANEDKNDSLKFFKFFKLSADLRYFIPTGKKSKIAIRLNAGIAQSYGDNDELPYEKYFFVGGSNSLRAWLPRRVGQGGYNGGVPNTKDKAVDYTFERNGNIMIESSIEWRFPIIHVGGDINGAFFVDAGNVWLSKGFNTDDAKFKLNSFLSQMAVGAGFGLRYDFTYFVIRTDFGLKILEPARPRSERYVLPNFSFSRNGTNPLIFNLGLGYPF